MFLWRGKKIAVKPIWEQGEASKEFLSVCNSGEFLIESKETKQRFAMVIKEEVTPSVDIPTKLQPLLEKCKEISVDKLRNGLPPMRDI